LFFSFLHITFMKMRVMKEGEEGLKVVVMKWEVTMEEVEMVILEDFLEALMEMEEEMMEEIKKWKVVEVGVITVEKHSLEKCTGEASTQIADYL